jgi:hypothetical protein
MAEHLTADYIGRRIEHAGAVMRCLHVKHPSTLLAQGRVLMIREALEGDAPRGDKHAYPMPSARDVSLMDEALSWILLIPNETKRRVVSLRSQYHPLRERHVMSWRACGAALRVSDKSAQRWHAEALAFLQAALAGWEVKNPAGCRVLAGHISLLWLEIAKGGAASR